MTMPSEQSEAETEHPKGCVLCLNTEEEHDLVTIQTREGEMEVCEPCAETHERRTT